VCARGDGIRRSKDLRAEIGKFPNSTNERKQMSTKTIKQRVALVALSALGAGLLSVVPVSSASATANAAPGDTTVAFAEDVLRIGTTANTTGSAVVAADTTLSSVGLVATSDIAGGRVAGTTQTAILLATGTLAVGAQTGSGDYGVITVEGGTITNAVATEGINSSATAVVQTGASQAYAASIKPNSGVTSMIVRAYHATAATYSSSSAVALASPSSGTLVGQITVTIAATSASGVMSPAESKLYYAPTTSSTSLTTDSLTNTGSQSNGGLGCVNIQLNDAYGQDITSPFGLLTVTATNNAVVKLDASTCSAGTTPGSTFFAAASPANVVVSVVQPVAGVALSTTLTASYNGVVVGTKAFTFRGKVAKVTVSSPKIGALSGTSDDLAKVKFEDAAGNIIYPTSSSTAYPLNSSTLAITASTATSVTSSAGIAATTVPNSSTGETGKISWSCGSVAGSSKISLNWVNTDGTVVTSNLFDAACAGPVYTYTASFDKASYAPGEVATLSVAFKDIKGNATNDYNAFVTGTVADGNIDATISTGGALTAVTSPLAADRTTNGVKKYTYTVGSTTGSFNAIVKFAADDAVTVPYSVKASGTNVTNEDVLKSIVSLIASINKQIQALQKLILKRR
jgi:hypothetical protein